jgi:hypothetical protein
MNASLIHKCVTLTADDDHCGELEEPGELLAIFAQRLNSPSQ